jgi:hypothetical protein
MRGNVIRFLPALTIASELVAEAPEITGATLNKPAGEMRKAS